MPSRLALAAIAIAFLAAASAAGAKLPPLKDPVFLNIGFVCQWQERCISRQQRAMKRALSFVKRQRPATWKVELCNRNASRQQGRAGRGRVDWIGFNNCIRNDDLKRPARTRRR